MVRLWLYNVVYGSGKFSVDRKVNGTRRRMEFFYCKIKILIFDINVAEQDTKRKRSINSACQNEIWKFFKISFILWAMWTVRV